MAKRKLGVVDGSLPVFSLFLTISFFQFGLHLISCDKLVKVKVAKVRYINIQITMKEMSGNNTSCIQANHREHAK